MKVLVTGAAGFIGSHVVERLLERGEEVIAVDSFDDVYDPSLKSINTRGYRHHPNCWFLPCGIEELPLLDDHQERFKTVDAIIHLAARAGVPLSLSDPGIYSHVNLCGTTALLEMARKRGIKNFVFASSSSVYGKNTKTPFSETDEVLTPISPYAATKRAGELLCHAHSHLYGIGVACLRFFTVFGPRQRPDLAMHKFARMIVEGKAIPVYGDGHSSRDYTYVTDIVSGVLGSLDFLRANPGRFEIFNLGGDRTVPLWRMIETLGSALGEKVSMDFLPMQPGDVPVTSADISKARSLLGFDPKMPFDEGVTRFARWFEKYHSGELTRRGAFLETDDA